MSTREYRFLRRGEEERLLTFLDHWPFEPPVRGSELFRKYVELDPTFEPRNVVVAEQDGELVGCVQVFPRTVETTLGALSVGGIGSVLTHPGCRGQGVASRLLQVAVVAMRERGMELSLLLATRTGFYQRLGWRTWAPANWHLKRPVAASRGALGSFVPRRLPTSDAVQRVDELQNVANARATLPGRIVRTRAEWTASFGLAGDPEEIILVAESDAEAPPGRMSSYLRATVLYDRLQLLEWGTCRGDAGVAELVTLVEHAADLIDPHSRREVRASWIPDDPLVAALERRGWAAEKPSIQGDDLDATAWMARALCPTIDLGESLPRASFGSWMSDRF